MTKGEITVTILRYVENPGGWGKCTLCGWTFDLDRAAAQLWESRGVGSRAMKGPICPRCVKDGPKEAAAKARELTKWWETTAMDLESLADENWPSIEELRKAESGE